MKTKLFFLITIILLSTYSHSQNLKRRASIGIAMGNVNDSISISHKSPKGKGVILLRVMPNSTASSAGLETGDILTHINGSITNSIPELQTVIQHIKQGDKITFNYYRNGKHKKGNTITKGAPKETYENATIAYSQVDYTNGSLRSILYTPKNKANAPVVYFLQGYTCGSIELNYFPNHPIRKLITDWVDNGYAVYRVEKANSGDSECKKGCMDMNFDEELEIFKEGYKALQNTKTVNTDKIFLFGHSMGGAVAPILAKEFNPAGVITYGTFVNSFFEYMQELTRVQGEMFNTPYAEIDADVRRVTPFWYELFIEKRSNTEILSNPVYDKMLTEEGTKATFKEGIFIDRNYTFWQTLNDISLVDEWLKVKSNTLALYGEYDIQIRGCIIF